MDEKFRNNMIEASEHLRKKIMEADDPKEIVKASVIYQKMSDTIVKYDLGCDQHDENVEKILNQKAIDDAKLALEREKAETLRENEAARLELEQERVETEAARLKLEEEKASHQKLHDLNEERAEDERFKFDCKKAKIDVLKDIGKWAIGTAVTVGTVVAAFRFDREGGLLTSTVGKNGIGSIIKKAFDIFK